MESFPESRVPPRCTKPDLTSPEVLYDRRSRDATPVSTCTPPADAVHDIGMLPSHVSDTRVCSPLWDVVGPSDSSQFSLCFSLRSSPPLRPPADSPMPFDASFCEGNEYHNSPFPEMPHPFHVETHAFPHGRPLAVSCTGFQIPITHSAGSLLSSPVRACSSSPEVCLNSSMLSPCGHDVRAITRYDARNIASHVDNSVSTSVISVSSSENGAAVQSHAWQPRQQSVRLPLSVAGSISDGFHRYDPVDFLQRRSGVVPYYVGCTGVPKKHYASVDVPGYCPFRLYEIYYYDTLRTKEGGSGRLCLDPYFLLSVSGHPTPTANRRPSRNVSFTARFEKALGEVLAVGYSELVSWNDEEGLGQYARTAATCGNAVIICKMCTKKSSDDSKVQCFPTNNAVLVEISRGNLWRFFTSNTCPNCRQLQSLPETVIIEKQIMVFGDKCSWLSCAENRDGHSKICGCAGPCVVSTKRDQPTARFPPGVSAQPVGARQNMSHGRLLHRSADSGPPAQLLNRVSEDGGRLGGHSRMASPGCWMSSSQSHSVDAFGHIMEAKRRRAEPCPVPHVPDGLHSGVSREAPRSARMVGIEHASFLLASLLHLLRNEWVLVIGSITVLLDIMGAPIPSGPRERMKSHVATFLLECLSSSCSWSHHESMQLLHNGHTDVSISGCGSEVVLEDLVNHARLKARFDLFRDQYHAPSWVTMIDLLRRLDALYLAVRYWYEEDVRLVVHGSDAFEDLSGSGEATRWFVEVLALMRVSPDMSQSSTAVNSHNCHSHRKGKQ